MKIFGTALWVAGVVLLLGCAGPGRESTGPGGFQPDAQLDRAARRGAAALDRGDLPAAAAAYAQALARARARDWPAGIARQAYHCAVVEVERGAPERATSLLAEARAAALRGGVDPAPVEVLSARLLRAGGRPVEAADRLTGISAASGLWFVHAQLDLASLDVETGALDRAAGHVAAAHAALEALDAPPSPGLWVEVCLAEASVARARGEGPVSVDAALARAEKFARQPGAEDRLPEVLAARAAAAVASENPSRAAELLYRAARSAYAQGRPASSARWLTEALHLLPADADPALQDRLASLFQEMQQASAALPSQNEESP